MRMQRYSRKASRLGLILVFAFGLTGAHALGLGEPRLLSEPGQPFLAELPLRDVPAQGLDHVRVRWAPEAGWLAQGLKPIATDRLVLTLIARDQGSVLRIASDQSIDTPTLDVLVELQWPQGRLLREIGFLLTPGLELKSASKVLPPTVLWVQAGDTAGALARSHIDHEGTTLSQALVALAQANPEAFVDGNVNRLRAGEWLKMPAPEQIRAIDPRWAQDTLSQQNEAFARYRAELAVQPASGAEDPGQVASGKVQTPQTQSVATPADRLTLSAPGAAAPDDQAQKLQAQQAAQRAAEINRNIQELNQIVQSGIPAPMATPPQVSGSARLEDLVRHPITPWLSATLVLLLLSYVGLRAARLRASSRFPENLSDDAAANPLAGRVDFDLQLPSVDDLPPLSPDVHATPTAVHRSKPVAEASPGMTAPWSSLSLDLGGPATEMETEGSPANTHQLRFELAQALWSRGLRQTAVVLAREVMQQAPAPWSEQARQWLNEHA